MTLRVILFIVLTCFSAQGIHLDEFSQKHSSMFGHAIAYITLGFFSLKGMLESIPELVRLKETPTGYKAFPIPAPGRNCSAGCECGPINVLYRQASV